MGWWILVSSASAELDPPNTPSAVHLATDDMELNQGSCPAKRWRVWELDGADVMDFAPLEFVANEEILLLCRL